MQIRHNLQKVEQRDGSVPAEWMMKHFDTMWDEDEADCLQETDNMWVAEWKHHLQIVPISVLLLSVLTQGRNTEQGFFLRLDVVIYGSEYKCCRTKGS